MAAWLLLNARCLVAVDKKVPAGPVRRCGKIVPEPQDLRDIIARWHDLAWLGLDDAVDPERDALMLPVSAKRVDLGGSGIKQ